MGQTEEEEMELVVSLGRMPECQKHKKVTKANKLNETERNQQDHCLPLELLLVALFTGVLELTYCHGHG